MAKISDDHAGDQFSVVQVISSAEQGQHEGKLTPVPRPITPEEIKQHNNAAKSGQRNADGEEKRSSFWAVVDGLVVDATEFLNTHPGSLKKLLSTDQPGTGATGERFGFSFSRGKNAHFPETGRRYQDGVKKFYRGSASGKLVETDAFLPPCAVEYPGYGKLVILGRLKQ